MVGTVLCGAATQKGKPGQPGGEDSRADLQSAEPRKALFPHVGRVMKED